MLFVVGRVAGIIRDAVVPRWHLLYWTPTTLPIAELPPTIEFLVVRNTTSGLPTATQEALRRSVGDAAVQAFNDRLSQGVILHALLSESAVAATLFIVLGSRQHFQHIALTDHDAMVLDARVDPKFRGRGLYSILLGQSVRALREDQIQRLYIDTPEDNDRSLRTFKRLGFQFLARYRYVRGKYQFEAKPL